MMSDPPTPSSSSASPPLKKLKLTENDEGEDEVEAAVVSPPVEMEMEVDGGGGEAERTVFNSPSSTPYLPPEKWLQILERRDFSNTDFLSIINTCPEFREMLMNERTDHLLPLALTSVMKYVPSQTFLKFRELTKRTKDEMDKALVSYRTSPSVAFHSSEISRLFFDSQLKRINTHYKFVRRGHVHDYLDHFQHADIPPESQPFLAGHVEFTLADNGSHDPQLDFEDYMTFKFFLESRKYGLYVSSVTFHISGYQDNDARQLFGKLSSLLHGIPNVKHLHLESRSTKFIMDGEVGPMVGEVVNRMDTFPPLPSLAYLNLDCLVLPENTLNRFIYHYGQQLEGLSVNGALFTNPRLKDPDVPLKYLFSKVKTLHIYQPGVNALLILKSLKGWAVELIQFSGVKEVARDAPTTQHVEEFCGSLFRELGNLKKVMCWDDNKLKCNVFKRPKV